MAVSTASGAQVSHGPPNLCCVVSKYVVSSRVARAASRARLGFAMLGLVPPTQAQYCHTHLPTYLYDGVNVADGRGKDLVASTPVDEPTAAADQRSLRARLLGARATA